MNPIPFNRAHLTGNESALMESVLKGGVRGGAGPVTPPAAARRPAPRPCSPS